MAALAPRSAIGACRNNHRPSLVVGRSSLRRSSRCYHITKASAETELFQSASSISLSLLDVVNSVAQGAPEPFQSVISTLGGDVASVVALQPKLMAIPRLGAVWYLLFSKPSPLVSIIDFYVTGPAVMALSSNFQGKTFTLRDRLGGGNFGVTYEAILDKERLVAKTLTNEQKKNRVVVKKVVTDAGYKQYNERRDLLKQGTLARGAVETGKVEAYMCRKVMRFPRARPVVASYLGEYVADSTEGGFTQGGQWLVWKFESDSTLGDALEGRLGRFPESISDLFLGGAVKNYDDEKRDALVVKSIMKQLLQGVEALHRMGIIHRDIKPENILITVKGEVKIIDFGAAVDFPTGINFNPLSGMLDYRYSPPEGLITPDNFPKAPPPAVAALAAPVAWQIAAPDRFDTFSCGLLLLQMAIPQLRSAQQQAKFKGDLEKYDYDLVAWRQQSPAARTWDFTLLDRNNGSGFDLATKLVCNRDSLRRGRLSAAEALRHPYILFGP